MADAAAASGNIAEDDINVDDITDADQTMTLAQQQDDTASRKDKKANGPTRTPTNNLEEEGRSLDNLRIEVERKGGVFEPGWSVEVLVRQQGNSIGTKDTYYFSPVGKRYRSRQEVVRVMGLAAADNRSSREKAFATAQKALSEADLPRDLACGATLTSWGAIDQGPKFSTPTQMHPVGFRATWPDRDSGAVFVSRIIASDDAPLYTVSMQQNPDATEKLVAEGSNPNEAWTRAAERQKKCLATAVARERALVPGGVKKRPQTPKAGPAAANVVSPSVPGSAKSEQQLKQANPGSVVSTQQLASEPSKAAVIASPKPAATPGTVETAVKPESEQPAVNGTDAVAKGLLGSSSAVANPADNATGTVNGDMAPKIKLVVKQSASEAKCTPVKSSPSQVTPLKAHAGDSAPAVPPELTKVEKRLIRAENLAGVWGAERFGFADTTVLLAMEGLPGMDELKNYEFVERRPGGWQTEMNRLEKEQVRYSRLAEKGAKGVAKGKGQLVKQQEKRKRAEEKAQQSKKRSSKKGTLEGWLTSNTPASDVNSPSKAGRPLSPALLPGSRAVVSPGSASEGHPAKRRKSSGQSAMARGSGMPAVGREVQGVVARILKAVEVRIEKAAERNVKKAARDAERQAKALDKEAARCKDAGVPLPPTVKALVQQSLRPVANLAPQPVYPVEDSMLPGAKLPAPAPQPLPPKGLLAPSAFSAALSVLELLARYQADLGIDKLPSLEDAEASVADPTAHSHAALNVHYPLIANVVNEMWEAACTVEENAERSDFRRKDVEPAFPPLTTESWPEAARRFFQLQEVAAMVKALDTSGGLGLAVGNPGNSASHPLALMDSAAVLQTLLAGCPSDADCHVAALPHAAVPSAPAGLLAMQDARALSSCEHLLRTVGVGTDENATELRGGNALMIAGRRMLWKLINDAHGKAMCGDAVKAAAAARFSAPLDLRIIAARLDEGVYGSGEEGLRRMAADVKYACALWRVGCARPKPCGFARSQGEKRSINVHSQVYEALGPALEDSLRLLAEGSEPASKAAQGTTAGASASAPASTDAPAASPAPEPKDAIVTDLDRLFVPWSACGVCWNNEDHRHLLICDETRGECHTYCTSPPLDDVPNGSWCSPRYLERSGLPRGDHGGLRWRSNGFEDHIQLCRLLSNVEYGELTDQQRAAVLHNLAAGLMDTSMMRQVVDGDLDKRKGLSEELRNLQRRLKHEEEERRKKVKEEREAKIARGLAAQQASIAQAVAAVKGPKAINAKPKAAATEGPAATKAAKESPAEDPNRRQPPPRGTRATTADAGRPLENAVSTLDLNSVKTLEYDIEELIERGVLLGVDRHWNRYWLLSAPRMQARQVNERVPIVCVETHGSQASEHEAAQLLSPKKVKKVGADFPMRNATWGCYATTTSLDALLQWLNPRGVREKELRRKLQSVRRGMVEATLPLPPAATGGETAEAATREAALHSTDLPHPTGAVSLPSAELPSTPRDHSPADAAGASPAGSTEQTAAAKDCSGSPTAGNKDRQHSGTAEPRVQALRDALLAARGAVPDAAVDSAVRATPQRQAYWRRLVAHASDPQALMAAVVVLEGFIRREYLKPWWRLWAFPTPAPEDTGTLAAVWMRLQALRSAIKTKLGVRESAALASPITARISARSIASAQNAAVASEGEGSGGDRDCDRGHIRAAAGWRRQRGAAVDSDEALALRLHEEMNGAGDSEGVERRRTVRARTRTCPKRTRELRASSRNNSTSDLRGSGGYRSKLRRTATESRPNYNHSPAALEADFESDSDRQDDDAGAHAAAGLNVASSDSGGGGGADSEVQLSELEDEERDHEDGGGNSGGSSEDEATTEQDSEGSPEKPIGRRTGRNTAASRDTRRGGTTGRVTRSTAR